MVWYIEYNWYHTHMEIQMQALDLTGKVFGELTAQTAAYADGKRGWHCMCSCGQARWVPTFQLTSGNNTTCGDSTKHQSIKPGDRFGKLVVQQLERDGKNRRYMAQCICDCGQVKLTAVRNLQRGSTTHCGCDRDYSNLGLPEGVSLTNSLVQSYKSNAKAKSLEFTLTDEECKSLFKGSCYFCGQPPSDIYTRKGAKGSLTFTGIDRIDSSKGYVRDNVDSCCTACNYLKGNRSNEQFLNHIRKICKHHT